MIKEIVEKQRNYFEKGNTLDIDNRIKVLKHIKQSLENNKQEIIKAFVSDFNKQEFDVISTELLMILSEINYFVKNLKKLSKPQKVKSNLINAPSKGYIYKEPYGTVLVIAPWNYPLQLALIPLIGAIASGNTVILKPSELSYNVSIVIEKIFKDFDEKLIKVINGDKEVSSQLLDERFDLIFYTGGERVGKIVMEKASKNLTPVILELGGKSPCIIDKDVNLDIATKRIVWGKFINAGQTCVAPDYILVNKDIKEMFISKVIEYVKKFYYENDKLDNSFPYIINENHVSRLSKLIDKNKVVFGGNIKGRTLEPTIMDNVTFDDLIMQEEIFGPIMPIITYSDLDEVINILSKKEKPLALYIFSNNKSNINKVINNLHFGGGCINDVIMHLTNENLPFGGVGNSGMGRYHGKYSFEAFTHEKAIFKKGYLELPIKYPKYTDNELKLLNKVIKYIER